AVRGGSREQRAFGLLRLPVNRGKGAAVRAGMLDARGEFRLFTDADGATPIVELKRLESAFAAGADIVIGSRVLLDPGVSVRALLHRKLAGRVFNAIVAWGGLVGVGVWQCGFKCFRSKAAVDVFGVFEASGFGCVGALVRR